MIFDDLFSIKQSFGKSKMLNKTKIQDSNIAQKNYFFLNYKI